MRININQYSRVTKLGQDAPRTRMSVWGDHFSASGNHFARMCCALRCLAGARNADLLGDLLIRTAEFRVSVARPDCCCNQTY
jgi:hypothetical protein